MKLSALCFAGALALSALVGCSGGDGEIAVDGATAPLTAEGNDSLFTIRVLDARTDGYALDGLVVKVTVDGGEPISVTCTAQDVDANGKLGKNDKLDCREGATNLLGPDVAGKEADVELTAKIDGEDTKIGSATWTPAK